MHVLDILKASGGLDAIANQLGIPPAVTRSGAEALLPAVLGGFSNLSGGSTPTGPDPVSLGTILDQFGGEFLAGDVLGPEPADIDRGNDVLDQIFGSQDVSRTVARHASERTGIDPAFLKKMLPILAMLVAGYLSSRRSQEASGRSGSLESVLGSLLGSGQKRDGVLGGLGALLDFDGDGNPLDDIVGVAGKLAP